MALADEVEIKVREMCNRITDLDSASLLNKARFLLKRQSESPGAEIEGVALQVAALCSMAAEREMLTHG